MQLRNLRFTALSLLFTYLFFFEYLPPFSRVHIPYDLQGYHYSLAEYTFQALKFGHFPEWDPTIYCGIGLASNIQAELFYPPAWLLFAANFGREQMSYASLEILVIAHIWLAFLLCYAWLRGRLLQGLACALGAGVYAFSGYACLQLQHLGLIAGYAWFPLGFIGVDEAIRRRDWKPLWKVVAASSLCLLAGYPPTWFVFVVSIAAYAIASWRPRIILGTAVGLAISLAVCAIQLLPARESSTFMLHEDRYGAGIRDAAFYLSYFIPNYFNFGFHVPIQTNPGKEYLYLGAPAMLGIALAWRKLREAIPFLAILAAGIVFLTNPFGLVWNAIKHSNLLSEICRSWYFLAAITLAAAPLAAYGLDDFLKRCTHPLARWTAAVSLMLLAGWSVWELRFWFAGDFASGLRAIYDPAITLVLFTFAMYVIRSQNGLLRIALAAAIVLSAGIDYKVFGTSKRFNASSGGGQPQFAPSHFIEIEPAVYAQLKAHREYRILLEGGPHPLELRQVGLMTPQGFDPFLPEQYRQLVTQNGMFHSSREFDLDPERKDALHLFGIRYVITSESHPVYRRLLADPDFHLLGRGESYYRVFEYLHATPPFGWESESGHVTLLHWRPEERDFAVPSTGGRFVLHEQLLPGWQASIDGRRASIERWHGAFQSIEVPPGDHVIQFRFRSQALRRGAAISAIALILLALALRFSQQRQSSANLK